MKPSRRDIHSYGMPLKSSIIYMYENTNPLNQLEILFIYHAYGQASILLFRKLYVV